MFLVMLLRRHRWQLAVLAFLAALLTACFPATVKPDALAPENLARVQALAWGDVAEYEAQYARYAAGTDPLPGADWYRNGCAHHLTLGFSRDFTPACHQHDFGYRNLRLHAETRTAEHRRFTDEVFLRHMRAACQGLEARQQPACERSAQWHYRITRMFGGLYFTARR